MLDNRKGESAAPEDPQAADVVEEVGDRQAGGWDVHADTVAAATENVCEEGVEAKEGTVDVKEHAVPQKPPRAQRDRSDDPPPLKGTRISHRLRSSAVEGAGEGGDEESPRSGTAYGKFIPDPQCRSQDLGDELLHDAGSAGAVAAEGESAASTIAERLCRRARPPLDRQQSKSSLPQDVPAPTPLTMQPGGNQDKKPSPTPVRAAEEVSVSLTAVAGRSRLRSGKVLDKGLCLPEEPTTSADSGASECGEQAEQKEEEIEPPPRRSANRRAERDMEKDTGSNGLSKEEGAAAVPTASVRASRRLQACVSSAPQRLGQATPAIPQTEVVTSIPTPTAPVASLGVTNAASTTKAGNRAQEGMQAVRKQSRRLRGVSPPIHTEEEVKPVAVPLSTRRGKAHKDSMGSSECANEVLLCVGKESAQAGALRTDEAPSEDNLEVEGHHSRAHDGTDVSGRAAVEVSVPTTKCMPQSESTHSPPPPSHTAAVKAGRKRALSSPKNTNTPRKAARRLDEVVSGAPYTRDTPVRTRRSAIEETPLGRPRRAAAAAAAAAVSGGRAAKSMQSTARHPTRSGSGRPVAKVAVKGRRHRVEDEDFNYIRVEDKHAKSQQGKVLRKYVGRTFEDLEVGTRDPFRFCRVVDVVQMDGRGPFLFQLFNPKMHKSVPQDKNSSSWAYQGCDEIIRSPKLYRWIDK